METEHGTIGELIPEAPGFTEARAIGFTFDDPEARGRIVIEESAYGLYVWLPDHSTKHPVALIDLFHMSDDGKSENPDEAIPQIVIHDPEGEREDPVGCVRFFKDGAQVEVDGKRVKLKNGYR